MLEKAGSAPIYFRKGFSGARAGRMVVRSLSTTNSTRSPFFSPSRLRISRGTVICPLLLIVLEGAIFTYLLYSKDIMLYGGRAAPLPLAPPNPPQHRPGASPFPFFFFSGPPPPGFPGVGV